MKIRISRLAILSLLVLCIQARPAKAQFLKELLNTAKQTAQSRANSKTAETTNKAIDKVDPSTQSKTKNNNTGSNGTTVNNAGAANSNAANQVPQDTAATSSVLGAFAKAAQQNHNDTSSADLTMKALGILAGGGGVSPQDSVAAINGFKTANGGTGLHYEYRMVTSGKKIKKTADTSTMFFTNKGEGRGEMVIPIPGVKTNRMISIVRAHQPRYSILLYPETKTYSLNIIDTALLKSNENYQVTKIGSETVMGYSCTHAKVISTSGSGMFKSTSTMDIWTSTSVPGYASFKALSSLYGSQMGAMGALEKAGCSGVLVKIIVTGKDASVEEDLIKAENKNCNADLFKIPAGYTESSGNMFSHMIQPAKK